MAYNTDGGNVDILVDETVASPASTIAITPIVGTYSKIILDCLLRTDKVGDADTARILFNSDSGANYYVLSTAFQSNTDTYGATRSGAAAFIGAIEAADGVANSFSSVTLEIPFYSSASVNKTMWSRSGLVQDGDADTDLSRYSNFSQRINVAAITRLDIINDGADDFITGCRIRLLGVK